MTQYILHHSIFSGKLNLNNCWWLQDRQMDTNFDNFPVATVFSTSFQVLRLAILKHKKKKEFVTVILPLVTWAERKCIISKFHVHFPWAYQKGFTLLKLLFDVHGPLIPLRFYSKFQSTWAKRTWSALLMIAVLDSTQSSFIRHT